MTRVLKAKTKAGRSIVYYVAPGRRGRVAREEFKRQCRGGKIERSSYEDAQRQLELAEMVPAQLALK